MNERRHPTQRAQDAQHEALSPSPTHGQDAGREHSPRKQKHEWLFHHMASMGQSDFARQAGGEFGEDLLAQIVGALGDLVDRPAGHPSDLVEAVVAAAQRHVARVQCDFLGRMGEALCCYQAAFDDHPDGDLPDDVKQDADENIAELASLALAQLAMLRFPDDAKAALAAQEVK